MLLCCDADFGIACLENAAQLTLEQLAEAGVNTSLTHVDFMVGTEDLSITGRTWDGQEVAIFREGNFVL